MALFVKLGKSVLKPCLHTLVFPRHIWNHTSLPHFSVRNVPVNHTPDERSRTSRRSKPWKSTRIVVGDYDAMLPRSWAAGLRAVMITAGFIDEARAGGRGPEVVLRGRRAPHAVFALRRTRRDRAAADRDTLGICARLQIAGQLYDLGGRSGKVESVK